MDIPDILIGTEIFRNLDAEEISLLVPCCEAVMVEPGDVVMKEGEGSDYLYVIATGGLDVVLPEESANYDRLSEVQLNTLEEGDCFGEYSLLDGSAVSANVVARIRSRLLRFRGTEVVDILDNNDRLGRKLYKNLLHILVGRLRQKDLELDLVFEGKGSTP